MDNSELERLIRILDEHEVGLSRDDVEWAFESLQTKQTIKEWVREYLSPTTLLKREEALL